MPVDLVCSECGKKFSRRFNFKRHFTSRHSDKKFFLPVKKSVSLKCGICEEICRDVERFNDHVLDAHNITLQTERHEFKSEPDFYSWKKTIEDRENVLFVKNTGRNILANKSIVINFQCHRSGYFMSKVSHRKRQIKTQGTSKINAYCPYRIKTIICNNGKIIAEFCSTHVGHKTDLAHINLPFLERKRIAEKIASKMSFDDILDELRSSATVDELKRKHFITRHDLYNIEKEFNLKSTGGSRLYHNETASVLEWIDKETQSSNSNSVLFYKPEGVFLSTHPNLNKEDCLLVIMTDAQVEILQKVGQSRICIDSTHQEMADNFEFICLFALDNSKRGFPFAFFISNRTDADGLNIFFSSIKNKTGIIYAEVFLSDTNPFCYTVWKNVMFSVNVHLFCSWHVRQEWKKNLSQIKNPAKKKESSKLLYALLEEPDEKNFQAMLTTISEQLHDDEETKGFGLYFRTHYLHSYEFWAYCYRKKLSLDSSLNMEYIHQTIKYLFLKGKTFLQAVPIIMHMLKNKHFYYVAVLEKGERIAKLKDMQIRHNKSCLMSTDLVFSNEDGSWKVASSSKLTLQYNVHLNKPDCNCSIVCKHCNVCIHKYNCTCIDSCVKWNMCKHIHLLCRALTSGEVEQNSVIIPDVALNESYDQLCSDTLGSEEMSPLLDDNAEELVKEGQVCEDIITTDQPVDTFQESIVQDECVQLSSESCGEQLYLLQPVSCGKLIESSTLLESKFELVKRFTDILNNVSAVDEINFIKEQINNIPSRLNTIQDGLLITSTYVNEEVIFDGNVNFLETSHL